MANSGTNPSIRGVVGRRAVIAALGAVPLVEGLRIGTGLGLPRASADEALPAPVAHWAFDAVNDPKALSRSGGTQGPLRGAEQESGWPLGRGRGLVSAVADVDREAGGQADT
ncbi:MAG: hypothetical protein QOF44_2490, partial [Streptomyces sp.]|nr:hypothetical protein [Streptomyces sp.]